MSSEGYDVLRLIEHGKSCYISSEYVYGGVLIQYLKYHPNISKEQLFSWMYEIVRQLLLFHNVRGNPCYQYVNPYSIIVNSKGELYLLDTGAQSNQPLVRKMQRKAVRDNFCPPREAGYNKNDMKSDIYGLGRTLQYILAATEPEPELTKREEKRFQKIISRCLNGQSKKSYQDIQEIQRCIPLYKRKERKSTKTLNVKKILTPISLVLTLTVIWQFTTHKGTERRTDMDGDVKEIVNARGSTAKDIEDELLAFDIGMIYLLELKEYRRAAGYLEQAETEGVDCYVMIARCLEDGEVKGQEYILQEKLKNAEDNIPKEREAVCLRGLIKGYAMLDSKEGAGNVVRLGESWLQLTKSEENQKEEVLLEVMEMIASAYETQEEKEKAAILYEEMLQMEVTEERRELIYKKTALLWESLKEKEKAWECCLRGIKELKDSGELRLLFIRMQCQDASVDREVCADTVREYIRELPEITGMDEFKKLQREYDIQVEGEEICVGK